MAFQRHVRRGRKFPKRKSLLNSAYLVLSSVLARLAASLAVVEAILAKADGVLAHTDVAITIALAAIFGHFALSTAKPHLGVHDGNVT